jgi:hypothetical protein
MRKSKEKTAIFFFDADEKKVTRKRQNVESKQRRFRKAEKFEPQALQPCPNKTSFKA